MLRNSNLQFTHISRLNDPFDCHPSLINFSDVPQDRLGGRPPEAIEALEQNQFERLSKSAWVCSLSKTHNSLLMWSYYSQHQGVCVGIDMTRADTYLARIHCALINGALKMEVQYVNIIEKPDYFRDAEDFFKYQLSAKAKEWEHEQEVRLVLLSPSCGFVPMHADDADEAGILNLEDFKAYPKIDGECFCSLYLGVNMKQEERDEMIKAAKNLNPNIAIYQMTTDPEAFWLKEEKIIS